MLRLKLVLNLLLWGSTSVSNTYEFVKILEAYEFAPQDMLMSFDIQSLFTRVPMEDCLLIVEQRLEELRQLPKSSDQNYIHEE